MKNIIQFIISCLLGLSPFKLGAQHQYELNDGWQCMNISKTSKKGEVLSNPSNQISGWLPATVPGTVLTTLLNNGLVPDPFYGMNNNSIPDIYNTGRDYYTYWFVKDFNEKTGNRDEQVWLHFRGVNYGCDIFLNGHRLNKQTHYGMFLRQTYNITSLLNQDGKNRIAVIVYPPNPVGNPNGGQGGDGTIARNVSHQYVAGWDWIQPVRDRNTGIWDKVIIEKTGKVNLKNPHIITEVPGRRFPGKPQSPAIIKVSAEVENPTANIIKGTLLFLLEGSIVKKEVVLGSRSVTEIQLPEFILKNPELWWPNNYGPQTLYTCKIQFLNENNQVLDQEEVKMGIREIQTQWNEHTGSMQVAVNGQKIFIKGGNWIISDAMLRFSPERYDAEIRFHRDMNLNLIRIWGGALTERPEFYEACDKYGLLVIQDFWISGDCNGRWLDPMKKEDQWIRRTYPDDHQLFVESIIDQVKMLRNHPSLALWCGGNELTPPDDILIQIQDSVLPSLDGTRYFIPYSNSHYMSYNFIGGNGDGPYTIQDVRSFWEKRSFPFNSEIGSVGTGDYESLERFIPEEHMVLPLDQYDKSDSMWDFHKYISYDGFIDPFGVPRNVKEFAIRAQLVNYDQYRGLIEGFSAHMWDWYTGVIIWKTQNPWTALRGQMYDCYLDPNACLYGLHHGSEPLHVMCSPVDGMTMIVNNTFETYRNLMLDIQAFDKDGKSTLLTTQITEIGPASVQKYVALQNVLDNLRKEEGIFLLLRLLNTDKHIISENLYWFPDSAGDYSGLQQMTTAKVRIEARRVSNGRIEVIIKNPENSPVAFFNRISLVNEQTGKRVLPVFYSDNYISVIPAEEKKVFIDYTPSDITESVRISLRGWNVKERYIDIQ